MMQQTLIEVSGRLAAGFTIGAKGVGRGGELRRGSQGRSVGMRRDFLRPAAHGACFAHLTNLELTHQTRQLPGFL